MRKPGESAICFLGPWAVGFAALTLAPLCAAVVLSFTRVEVGSTGWRVTWVGTTHYAQALSGDPRFYQALANSLFFSVISVPLGLCTSLAVAMLLLKPVRGAAFFRAMAYLPHVLGGVATIVIWSWLFNPQFGWINLIIRSTYVILDPLIRVFHGAGTSDWPLPNWLYSSSGCKPAVIIMSVWTMGGSMLIFLAALRRVPTTLYEASSLDGASAWHQFHTITVPQITPAILFNGTLGLIFAMQSFNEAYLLQTRRQDDGLLFYALYLYQVAFESPYQLGYACSLAVILLAVLGLMVFPLLWTSRRWVYYAAKGPNHA